MILNPLPLSDSVSPANHKRGTSAMNKAFLSFILLSAFLSASAVHADLYMWVDEQGVRHYSNVGPPDTQSRIQKKEEIPYDENRAVYLENLRKEQEQQNLIENQLKQEKEKQSEIAQKDQKDKRDTDTKIEEVKALSKKVEKDTEKVKEDVEALKRMDKAGGYYPAGHHCPSSHKRCKSRQADSPVPKAFVRKESSRYQYPIVTGNRTSEIPRAAEDVQPMKK